MVVTKKTNTPEMRQATAPERDIRPLVPRPRSGVSGAAIAGVVIVTALLLFLILDAHRRTLSAPTAIPHPAIADAVSAPPPLYVPPVPAAAVIPEKDAEHLPDQVPETTPPVVDSPVSAPFHEQPVAPVLSSSRTVSGSAPALVLDTSHAAPSAVGGQKKSDGSQSSGNETPASPQRARAVIFTGPSATVPQGTIIPAVLETALDSSHAGFSRALVQHDVRGFDGSQILIPRGSRLIGQYAGNVTQGLQRAFIMWTRLIRPDGVTIALNSPVADPIGRAGVDADVNDHFFSRFSGAILQSVLNIGVNLATRSSNYPVVLALPGSFQGNNTTTVQSAQIAPTLTVKPGTSISVFVAQDLDFGGTEKTAKGNDRLGDR